MQPRFSLLQFVLSVNTNTDMKKIAGGIVIRAVIMAGGSGTRLRPLTCDLPKPLVPIVNRPVMSYTVDLLKKHGIENIAVTLAYLPGKIKDYYGAGEEFGVNMQYFVEDTPLGTAGSVKNTGDFLQDTFVVISGDALTDLDLSAALDFHKQRRSQATLVLHRQPIPLEYGVVITDAQGRITRFLEKPSWGEVFSDTVNTGIYILESGVMDYLTPGQKYDFSKDLFPRLLAEGIPLYGYVTEGYWCDIGDLSSYRQAQFDALEGKVDINIAAVEKEPGIWVGEECRLADTVELQAPVYLGRGCMVEEGVKLGPYTVINDFCRVEEGASLKRTVVWKYTLLGQKVECRGATVCDKVSLATGVRVFEDAVVGSGTILEPGVTLRPGVKVWPGKQVVEDTELRQNLVWGSRLSRRLFGRKDIKGQFNVEVTPEFASRLGSAFAALAGKPELFVVTGDYLEASALVADGLTAGILACGSRVMRAAGLAAPMTRFAVRHYQAWGGIHVRMDGIKKNHVHLEFFGATGANLDRSAERKLEAVFNSDDFQRVAAEVVASAEQNNEILRLYFAEGASGLRVLRPGKTGPVVAVGAETEQIAFLASSFLAYIGCVVKKGGGSAAAVSGAVLDNSADFGVFLGADGEGVALVTETGVQVSPEEYRALCTALALETRGRALVLPHDTPQAIRDMAKGRADLVPVKSAPGEMMAEMMRRRKDRRVALQYILHFDGIQAAGRIADFLASRKGKLSQVLAELPELYVKNLVIPCQWGEKGRVLRELVDQHSSEQLELQEGVKIRNDKGWTLVLPDSEKPQFNIYAEGHSEEFAQELAAEFTRKVSSLLGKNIKGKD